MGLSGKIRPATYGCAPNARLSMQKTCIEAGHNSGQMDWTSPDSSEQPGGGHADLGRLGGAVVLGIEEVEKGLGGIISPGLDEAAYG